MEEPGTVNFSNYLVSCMGAVFLFSYSIMFCHLQGKRRFDLEPPRGPFGTKVRHLLKFTFVIRYLRVAVIIFAALIVDGVVRAKLEVVVQSFFAIRYQWMILRAMD